MMPLPPSATGRQCSHCSTRHSSINTCVVANNVASQVPVHANLVLAANTFTNLRGPGLFITRANDVVVVNNQFTNTNLSRLPFVNLGSANLGGSLVIDHAHNIFLSNNTMQGATSGPISIDSKSTDGIKR